MNGRIDSHATASSGALLVALCVVGLASWGCRSDREELTVEPTGQGACAGTCHGEGANPAPPRDTDGNADPNLRSVGLHTLHLTASAAHQAVACSACHVVPARTEDKGHADDARPAEVKFAEMAASGGRTPGYDPATGTCANTYCHAGPASAKSPWKGEVVWVASTGGGGTCAESCHGSPPGGSHPKSKACEQCHGETAGPNLTIVAAERHIDGVLQLTPKGCTACHGSEENAAPPVDLDGGTDPTTVSVGVHQAHLSGGAFSRPVSCSDCHVVPAEIGDPGHTDDDDGIAEVRFSGVSVARGAEPIWDRESASCSASYCHGSRAWGGSGSDVVWTAPQTEQAECGSCHGLPPPRPHVADTDCERCHTETAGPGMTIANRSLHVNGVVDIPGGPCNKCHGDETSSAPPRDIVGNTDTALRSVGAHRQHLDADKMKVAQPFACDVCHELPPVSTTHMSGAAEIVFSGIASGTVAGAPVTHQSVPSYSRGAARCSNVYCHGDWAEESNPSGGSATSPVWTQVDGSQVSCGGCHGFPPPPPHPASASCQHCHPSVINAQMQFVDISKHVNGRVDF